MPITSGFNHVATLTTDLDRYAEFYRVAFGAEIVFRMEAQGDHPKMYIIDLGGGAALNTFEVPPDEIIGQRRRQGHRGAIDHFGIAVTSRGDIEVVRDRLVAIAADVGEIQRLGDTWSLFFRDCDGMELEVCAPVEAV